MLLTVLWEAVAQGFGLVCGLLFCCFVAGFWTGTGADLVQFWQHNIAGVGLIL